MDRPRPWLRNVKADDLNSETVKFDRLKVENPQGEKLGKVDGFIIDVDNARPYYVVVDSGGWFKSKNYLVPIGFSVLDPERKVILADLSRERIRRFPGFDKDEFEKLSGQELEQFARATASVCSVTEVMVFDDPEPWSEWQPHYQQPDWWESNYYSPERAGAKRVTAGAALPKREERQADRQPAIARDSATPRRD